MRHNQMLCLHPGTDISRCCAYSLVGTVRACSLGSSTTPQRRSACLPHSARRMSLLPLPVLAQINLMSRLHGHRLRLEVLISKV
jgi:hypothetical protein